MDLRTFAAWPVASVGIPFLSVGIGAVLISIDQFLFSQILIGVAGVWGIVSLWFSLPYESKWSTPCLLIIIAITVCTIILIHNYSENKYLESDTGLLIPSDQPSPINHCPPYNYNFLLDVGSNSVNVSRFPRDFLIMGDENVLSIDRDKTGNIDLSATIRGDDGRVVVTVENNELKINKNNYFTKSRPDRSTLIVRDQFNVEVINFVYLNPRAASITGMFRNGKFKINVAHDQMKIDTPNVKDMTVAQECYRGGIIRVNDYGVILDTTN